MEQSVRVQAWVPGKAGTRQATVRRLAADIRGRTYLSRGCPRQLIEIPIGLPMHALQ